ncbi:Long-chain-alcohol oxidase FAO1 [Auxenochlorella protothecoides]|uniref:long-chain-alcohol oxidase n=1 Tax=Auxenochlorella protothecoides TaxID=3075 RepID=A0A087SHH9_AUXPR|nr:Long-chain-alcohol oxidase FAO1 [Auxenochlorella protothecoides]KFM25183.1 Long-chain-alcohol oxidase FAO1 [Auxenochlorella protothecoides]
MDSRREPLQALAGVVAGPYGPGMDQARKLGLSEVEELYAYDGGQDSGVVDKVLALLDRHAPRADRRQLGIFLELLRWRLGTLLLCGRDCMHGWLGAPQAFVALSPAQREAAVLAWVRAGSLSQIKAGAWTGVKKLVALCLMSKLEADGSSRAMRALGFPIRDPRSDPARTERAGRAEAGLEAAICDVASFSAASATDVTALAARLRSLGLQPVDPARCAPPGTPAALLAGAPHLVLSADVVVEDEGYSALYEAGGFMQDSRGLMGVLAGATLGGGTRVNWCASFRTPEHVRREWAAAHGLLCFTGATYESAMDAVCERLGVRTGYRHSAMCRSLAQGCRELGEPVSEVKRNCQVDDCSSYCTLGCKLGGKQDSVRAWLTEAVDAGARILTGAWAERIVTETRGSAGRPARVVGVSLRGGSPGTKGHGLRIAVAARLVVAAGGSLHTPALLLRSGIQGRGNVGRHLHLHPVCMTLGFLRSPPRLDAAVGLAGAATPPLPDLEDRGGRPASDHGSVQLWDGTGMSTFSAARGDWEGSGYGSLLYTPQVLPGSVLSSMPWLGQADFKKYMARLPDASLFLTIVRDRGEGSITLDGDGQPVVNYSLSAEDEGAMASGSAFAARVAAAAGADTVMTLDADPRCRFLFVDEGAGSGVSVMNGEVVAGAGGTPSLPAQLAPEGPASLLTPADEAALALGNAAPASGSGAAQARHPAFRRWLAEREAGGIATRRTPLFSAHQMGSARMGTDPAASVVDAEGQSWDVAGLYVMDASTFPTATGGVNPMVTVESIAYMLSSFLARKEAHQTRTDE